MILNTVTDCRYVGSAARAISGRWGEHRYHLRRGTHRNRHLQASWEKHGEDAFRFIVLENTPAETVLDVEERWYQQFKQAKFPLYNKHEHVRSQLGMKHTPDTVERMRRALTGLKRTPEQCERQRQRMQGVKPVHMYETSVKTWPPLVDPEGVVHTITNLRKFCMERGLDTSSLRKVVIGEHPHYKGWRLHDGGVPTPYTARLRQVRATYRLVAPDGTVQSTNNIEAFCREHGLNPQSLRRACHGQQAHHQGWTGTVEQEADR